MISRCVKWKNMMWNFVNVSGGPGRKTHKRDVLATWIFTFCKMIFGSLMIFGSIFLLFKKYKAENYNLVIPNHNFSKGHVAPLTINLSNPRVSNQKGTLVAYLHILNALVWMLGELNNRFREFRNQLRHYTHLSHSSNNIIYKASNCFSRGPILDIKIKLMMTRLNSSERWTYHWALKVSKMHLWGAHGSSILGLVPLIDGFWRLLGPTLAFNTGIPKYFHKIPGCYIHTSLRSLA